MQLPQSAGPARSAEASHTATICKTPLLMAQHYALVDALNMPVDGGAAAKVAACGSRQIRVLTHPQRGYMRRRLRLPCRAPSTIRAATARRPTQFGKKASSSTLQTDVTLPRASVAVWLSNKIRLGGNRCWSVGTRGLHPTTAYTPHAMHVYVVSVVHHRPLADYQPDCTTLMNLSRYGPSFARDRRGRDKPDATVRGR